jgi:toxin ParE1/3/4
MAFEVIVDTRAEKEIDEAIGYIYERNQSAANKLYSEVIASYKTLAINPFYHIRYNSIRCLPIKGFSLMIHFSINELKKIVYIHAVIHTSKNPKKFWLKKNG